MYCLGVLGEKGVCREVQDPQRVWGFGALCTRSKYYAWTCSMEEAEASYQSQMPPFSSVPIALRNLNACQQLEGDLLACVTSVYFRCPLDTAVCTSVIPCYLFA